MKKSYAYNEMSDRRCRLCNKPLKRRLVEEQDAKICYTCAKEQMILNGVGMSRVKRMFG